MKKALAFICVLALIVSMCSVFSFAAEPDVKVPQEGTRTGGVHYVVKTAAHMYVRDSYNSGYVFQGFIPVGTHLVAGFTSGDFAYVTYNSYSGYVPLSQLTEVQ